MLTLLSMLGGGLFRLVPFVVDFFKQKQDADHEYRMTQLQIDIDKARAAQQIDLTHAQAEIATSTAEMGAMVEALKAQGTPTGNRFIDGVSASVRPFLTYYWCIGLYGGAKAIQVYVALQQHASLLALVPILITEFDEDVIGGMLSFWFVDRALRRMSGK